MLDKISSDIIVDGCCITICDCLVGIIKTYSLSIFIQSELLLILERHVSRGVKILVSRGRPCEGFVACLSKVAVFDCIFQETDSDLYGALKYIVATNCCQQ